MNRAFHLSLTVALLVGFFPGGFASAQEDFFYVRGEKIPITISAEKICIKFKSGVSKSQIQDVLSSETQLGELRPLLPGTGENFFTISLKSADDVRQLMQRLRTRPEVEIVNPVYGVVGITATRVMHHLST